MIYQRLSQSSHLSLHDIRTIPRMCAGFPFDLFFEPCHLIEYLIQEYNTQHLSFFCTVTVDHVTFLHEKELTLYIMDSIFGSIFFFKLQTKAILVLLAWNSISISSKLVSEYTVSILDVGFIISSALSYLLASFKYFIANYLTLMTPVTLFLFSL